MRRAIAWVLVCAAIVACGGKSTDDGSSGKGGKGGKGGTTATGGAGGTGGTGGSVGGTGGYYDAGPPPVTNKLDLLFMIDNSISMGDKQQLLAEAVPRLIQQLVTPSVDPSTGKPSIQAITDLHVGIISSSIGGHGADQCSESGQNFNPTQDDHARLMPSVRPGLPSYQNLGFLWWDPSAKAAPPGESDMTKLATDFATHVVSAGESGCGYEAQLEAWYRFLVDPAPPLKIVLNGTNAELQGIDDVVLMQRKDFLRPDSAVAILMLTDENDCSVVDGGFNWISAQLSQANNTPFHMARAAQACATDPNSACCRPCNANESGPPPGCVDLGADPECAKGPWDDSGDHPNLRCWHQKQRFGLDLLYPTRKYVEGLSQPLVCPSWASDEKGICTADQRVPNPLLINRDPRLVFLVGVVGVPWQDLATDATLADPNALDFLSSDELAQKGRWDWLVPQCKTPVSDPLPHPMSICQEWDLVDQPDDPLMIESIKPRNGTNPATGAPVSPETSGSFANPINGHEWLTDDADLEYTCIFPLTVPKDCPASPLGCDCDDPDPNVPKNPLCQDAAGNYSKTQSFGKAFPGQRELEVMKDLGSQSVVASICAKSVTNGGNSAYGYNAAMSALVRRLGSVLPPP